MLFEDARATLDEIDIDGPLAISPQTTIMETLELMSEQNKQSYGVINAQGKLMGMVTKSDLATVGLGDTAVAIQLLQETPPEYIAKTVSGKMVYMDKAYHFNGKTSVIAIAETKLNNYELQDRLVIVGNDSEAQEAAIRKGAGILVAVWTEHIEESVIALAKEYHCPIILSGHGTMNTSRYLFFSPPVKLLMKTDLVSFNKNEFVDEVGKKMLKSRYRSYPVIDDENHLIGYVSRYHILNQHNKKVILVDHNEYAQSVKSIEKADLLEVVDHHRVCAKDKGLAKMLAEVAELDIDVFAKEMFKVSSNISNKTPRELLNQDIKKFEIDGRTVMISQVIAYQVSEAKEIEETLQSEMEKFAQEKGLDLLVVAFTSILENGSVFYAAGEIADVVAEAFPNHFEEEHSFQEDILSRKNQIVPLLSRAIINSVH